MTCFKYIFSRDYRYSEISDSIREHLEEKVEDLVEDGMSRQEAVRVAQREFGNVTLIEQRSRDVWQDKFVTPLVSDFRFSVGQLSKTPIFTLTAILVLAIGIGSNTAVLSLLYTITLRDLPVHNASELAFIRIAIPAFESSNPGTSYPMFEQLRRQQQSFSDVCGWTVGRVSILDTDDALRSVNVSMVTGNTFDLLGVTPALGRMFTASDDRMRSPGDRWPIVLSYSFWKENFHGNPSIIGKPITVSEIPGVIVGVAPPMFEGIIMGLPSKAFLPVHFLENAGIDDDDPTLSLLSPTNFRFLVIGRLKPGITLRQAGTEINGYTKSVFLPMISNSFRATAKLKAATLQVVSARHGLSRLTQYLIPLWSLQTIAIGFFFLCCFNVAGLQLIRISVRRREFAIRIALGADRWHLAITIPRR